MNDALETILAAGPPDTDALKVRAFTRTSRAQFVRHYKHHTVVAGRHRRARDERPDLVQ